jgi:hypothetical protein
MRETSEVMVAQIKVRNCLTILPIGKETHKLKRVTALGLPLGAQHVEARCPQRTQLRGESGGRFRVTTNDRGRY